MRGVAVGHLSSNSYVVYDPGSMEGVLIDAGGDPHRILEMLGHVKVRRVIATHGHFDHVIAIDELREVMQLEFYIHEAEKQILELIPTQTRQWLGVEFKPPKPDGYLVDGDVIEVGDNRMKIIHTPGHSPGSISLHIGGVVFTGDTLFAGSIGRTDLPGGSFDEIVRSIKEKLYVLSDDTKVYPGHGEETSIGIEKMTNPFVRA